MSEEKKSTPVPLMFRFTNFLGTVFNSSHLRRFFGAVPSAHFTDEGLMNARPIKNILSTFAIGLGGALKKLIALLLLAMFSTTAFAITDAQLFAYAEANFPGIFTGAATAGVIPPYNYRYYPASRNYLAVDTSGVVYVLGPYTGDVVTAVGPVAAYAATITAWEATLPVKPTCTSPQVLTNGVCVTPTPAVPTGYVSQGGLTWMPATALKTWADANAYCTGTTINGQTGWRLPTKDELSALYSAYPNNSPELRAQGWKLGVPWSSTPYDYYGLSFHYVVNMFIGGARWLPDTGTGGYVTCVR